MTCSNQATTSMVLHRYMVVLRLGGVYADVDTECKKPLNDLILPRDTMLVGWENEFPNMEHARFRSYARERQVLHSPAGALVCLLKAT